MSRACKDKLNLFSVTAQDPPASETPVAEPGRCAGEPWITEDENAAPPEQYVPCATNSDCVDHEMQGCCHSFIVAVNARFRHCFGERNARANCRAHCALSPAGLIARRPTCQNSSCVLALEDGTSRPVLRQPMYTGSE